MLEGLDLDFGEGSGEGWSGGHGIIERMTCFNRDKPSPFGAQKPRMPIPAANTLFLCIK